MFSGNKKIDDEQMKGTAQAYGRRLGFLIASLNVSSDLKEDLLTILPHMTIAQIERLSDLLQSTYISEQTVVADDKFAAELKKIKSDYSESQDKLNQATALALANLEQKIA